ncbi:Eco57I restriction-modification methylase domain-containing protein [Trichlorobacter lovleyi]|uniref:type IIG restriction enzyme/methyltransferase n=1 Tax=Trichlorobacter lovleyi TaxID=313985 RepID=UPI00224057C6|nr:TaqI-like C-terminal specificity domain-containing protein [Trichlorobacter lovleyi]QOX77427.1 Eco57I restriction-modification methylase domain-containing protein [Trichlorobacter lovleyi]
MKLTILPPQKSLNKAYLKQSLKRDQIDLFRANLARMFERIRTGTDEHEEHLKNIVSDFLKDTWYKQTHEINTSGRTDLVIHNGTNSKDTVGVLLEVKRPGNSAEMISHDKPNSKALHELLHYYMQERYIKGNLEVRRLIVCNIYEWYIFDAADFERLFFQNKKFVESYQKWSNGLFSGDKTDWLYREILKPFVEGELENLPCTYFNLKEYERIVRNPAKAEDNKLIALYKVLSPPHLLKQSFANDSNSLNREFYSELLHIIGLEEVKEKGKKLIRRKPEGKRDDGSLLENTCNILKTRGRLSVLANPQQYGADADEQYFSVALELCITWLNRLLFLKLLEGQLITYHKGDRSHAFLNSSRIDDFDELNELFFEVLAVRVDERSQSVREKFGAIPYLNSSLFEESDLERATIRINELKNRLDLPLSSSTVLKATNGKRLTGSKNTLNYLFEFLDAYDFGAEGSAEIQEQNKSIINASVLGLIFEKINGYRDGSFFTPGFITMYICRETIQRAVLHKFNNTYGWDCSSLIDLHNEIYRQRVPVNDANALINSLKICDPAVGSGHFLVSALNEIIAIKSQLRILADRDGKLLRCDLTIENDELIVTVDDQIFEYHFKDSESQRIQETLFHEKETIIENCLFGVDINPKSVMICRLRLWIELLKNAYYRRNSDQLETLPNIDINIKCGNSLVSRFALAGMPSLPAAGRKKQKELADKYRELVFFYKHAPSNKAEVRKQIENLKHSLENFGLPNDKELIALRKKENEVAQLGFAFDKKGTEARQKLMKEVEALQTRFAEKERLLYSNAFEWRFEFPEVLDDAGEFIGFDAVIGNPPYGVAMAKELKQWYQTYTLRGESYVLFVEKALSLLKYQGQFSFIIPDTYLNLNFTAPLRSHLLQNSYLQELVLLPSRVFDDATVDTTLLFTEKAASAEVFHQSSVRVKSFSKQASQIDLDLPEYAATADTVSWHTQGSFNVQLGGAAETLLNRLVTTLPSIAELAEMFSGIKAYEVGKGNPPQTEAVRSTKPFTSTVQKHKDFLPFYDGKHVGRYRIFWEKNNWLHYGPWLAAPRKPQNFVGEKILIRKIVADTLIASYVPETSYCNTLLHVLKIKPEHKLSYLYLLGVLNSRFIGWYFKNRFQISAEDTFPQIMISDIQQFPVPEAPEDQQVPIVERVQQILDAPDSPEVPRLEAEIDRLVYALYNLTDEEIALVEKASAKGGTL